MKQFSRKISTYSPDWAGVCSALYELGGMQVIHDASGCNSTYTTFDEPRWYDMDSNFFISGLVEMDAILGGSDDKLVEDVIQAAQALSPAFISLAGSPIPMMIGTDFKGIANLIERRTGIPCFGFATNGMGYYPKGAGMALAAVADRFCPEGMQPLPCEAGQPLAVNILGATPLDFSITGNVPALQNWIREQGCTLVSTWAMGSSLEEISQAGKAHVNLVVSACGLPAAQKLQKKYGTPFVIGVPFGEAVSQRLLSLLRQAAQTGENQFLQGRDSSGQSAAKALIIGEQVSANSLRCCLQEDFGLEDVTVLCPLDPPDSLRLPQDLSTDAEEEIEKVLPGFDLILADPIYRRILPAGWNKSFVDMPHEAFSSRIYREQIPLLIASQANKYLGAFLNTL